MQHRNWTESPWGCPWGSMENHTNCLRFGNPADSNLDPSRGNNMSIYIYMENIFQNRTQIVRKSILGCTFRGYDLWLSSLDNYGLSTLKNRFNTVNGTSFPLYTLTWWVCVLLHLLSLQISSDRTHSGFISFMNCCLALTSLSGSQRVLTQFQKAPLWFSPPLVPPAASGYPYQKGYIGSLVRSVGPPTAGPFAFNVPNVH